MVYMVPIRRLLHATKATLPMNERGFLGSSKLGHRVSRDQRYHTNLFPLK